MGIDSILIVKPSSMGDVVHTLPAAQALRAAYPKARIVWVVERNHAPLLARQPWLDELIEWNRHQASSWLGFMRRLRKTKWDLAIDFQGLFRSGFITWASGARQRVGFVSAAEHAHWFYTHRVPLVTMDKHAVERYLDLAEVVGGVLEGVPIERPYLQGAPRRDDSSSSRRLFPLVASEEDKQQVAQWLSQHEHDPSRDRLVVLNPGCRKPANQWPVDRYVTLARQLLAEPTVKVVVSGGPNQCLLCATIAEQTDRKVWRADVGFSLTGLAELLSHAAVVVTGDTGPMHLAAAVGTPIVALFGPANPVRTGPYTANACVIQSQVGCAPCYGTTCPLGQNAPSCMAAIEPDQVWQTVRSILAE